MSLPPGFLDELRSRLSLGQVVGRRVQWDLRKSNQAKGDLWAPCPFHEERTASFHVDDRKGVYYCFGCQAKGDAIAFVRETQNVSFPEAVEILAREAGMEMPARDPKAQARASRAARLVEVMEAAVRHLRLQLGARPAQGARDYLAGRGLDEAAQARFELGYARADRQGLWRHLRAQGVEGELIVEAGLCARPEDGGEPYDRFRDRIIFPIRDARGRAIALGGRAMDPQARAKYLNSPETDLFDKGRTLYHHGPARDACAKGATLIVAEGYMDVIALVRAGFEGAVAPLGTAVAEAQLQLAWRLHPEPVVALDGDAAGLRAALRLVDLALPHLAPERTLRFALLPEGHDPDDLLRAEGPEAMTRAIEDALPLSRMLWRREVEARALDTPERRAGLDQALREAVRLIRDPSVRGHYERELERLKRELFGVDEPPAPPPRIGRDARAPHRRGAWTPPPQGARSSTRASFLVAEEGAAARVREAVILATLLVHPELFDEVEGALEAIEWSPAMRPTLQAVLRHRAVAAACAGELGEGALETLMAQSHVRLTPAVRRPDDRMAARACLEGELAKLAARQGLNREIEEAAADLGALAVEGAPEGVGEGVTWRLGQAAAALGQAERSLGEDRAAFEIAGNGAALDREELARGRAAFEGIDYGRGGRAARRRGPPGAVQDGKRRI